MSLNLLGEETIVDVSGSTVTRDKEEDRVGFDYCHQRASGASLRAHAAVFGNKNKNK